MPIPTAADIALINDTLKQTLPYALEAGYTEKYLSDKFNYWNYTANNTWTSPEVAQYLQSWFYYLAIFARFRTGIGITQIVLGVLGLLGYCATAALLRGKDFKTPTYLYHKFLMVIEAFHSIVIIIIGQSMFNMRTSGSLDYCFFVSNVCMNLTQIIAMAGDCITVAMTIERIAALWSVAGGCFATVNTNRFAIGAIVLAALPATTMFPYFGMFKCAFDQQTVVNGGSDFYTVLIKIGYEKATSILSTLRAAVSIATTAMVVIGAVRWRRANGRLLKKAGKLPDAVMARERRKLRASWQMTVLCIAVALPTVLFSIHYGVDAFYLNPIVQASVNSQRPSPGYPFAFAQWSARVIGSAYLINVYMKNLWLCVSHTMHFYLYCLFCASFRKQAGKFLGGWICVCQVGLKRGQVGPDGTTSGSSEMTAQVGKPGGGKRITVETVRDLS